MKDEGKGNLESLQRNTRRIRRLVSEDNVEGREVSTRQPPRLGDVAPGLRNEAPPNDAAKLDAVECLDGGQSGLCWSDHCYAVSSAGQQTRGVGCYPSRTTDDVW